MQAEPSMRQLLHNTWHSSVPHAQQAGSHSASRSLAIRRMSSASVPAANRLPSPLRKRQAVGAHNDHFPKTDLSLVRFDTRPFPTLHAAYDESGVAQAKRMAFGEISDQRKSLTRPIRGVIIPRIVSHICVTTYNTNQKSLGCPTAPVGRELVSLNGYEIKRRLIRLVGHSRYVWYAASQ
jgi:hypothetical protein